MQLVISIYFQNYWLNAKVDFHGDLQREISAQELTDQ